MPGLSSTGSRSSSTSEAKRRCEAVRPKKPGKAQRLDARDRRLPAPAGRLPSEHRCRRRPAGPGGSRRRRAAGLAKRRDELALRRPLGGLLQDGVDDLVGVGATGAGMGGDGTPATCADLGRIAVEAERVLPDQPDRQEVGERVVRATGELRLPQPIAGILRPAAQRHQQLVEIGLQRRRAAGRAASRRAASAGCASRALRET